MELDLDHIERIAKQRQEAGGRVTARPEVILEMAARIRALESRASNAGGAVAWQVRAIGSELWENCTRELYEDTLRTGRYCGFERAPECEVR